MASWFGRWRAVLPRNCSVQGQPVLAGFNDPESRGDVVCGMPCLKGLVSVGRRRPLKVLRVVIVVLGSFYFESFDNRFSYSPGYSASRLVAAHADCFVAVVGLLEIGKAAFDCYRLGGDSAGIPVVGMVDCPDVCEGDIEVRIWCALHVSAEGGACQHPR